MTSRATKDQWTRALDKLSISPEVLSDLEVDLTAIRAHLDSLSGDLDLAQLVPLEDPYDHRRGNHLLVLAMAARNIDGATRKPEKHNGDLVITSDRVIDGNLEVDGTLQVVGGSLIVIGDVRAKNYVDSSMDWSSVAIAGNMAVEQVLATEGYFGVGGRMSARLAVFSFNQGYTKVLGGFEGAALVESDHGGSRIFGPVAADVVLYDELMLDGDRDPDELEGLLPLLTEEIAEKISEEMDVGPIVIEALQAGQPVLA